MIVGRLNPLTLAVTTVSKVDSKTINKPLLKVNSRERKAHRRERDASKAQKRA